MKPNFRLTVLFILIFLSSLVSINHAQENATSQLIQSLEFREVDIKDVLRQLAKQYNLNIVFSEKVSGLITVQLVNVTLEEALDSIITVNGFVYTKKGQVIKVITAAEAQQEGKQTKLFKLNNASAATLKDSLKKVLTADGSIEADSRSNSLIVTDTLAVINKIEGMIPSLDEITPQVLIEAKMIETSLTKTEKLGIDWTTTITASASKRPITWPFNKWGSDKDIYPVGKYTSEYDADTDTWKITSDFPFKGESVFYPGSESRLATFPTVGADQFSFGTLDFTGLKAIFDFLKERQNTKLIANPRIVTLNNQKATIHVGRSVPLPTYERNPTTGDMEITGWGTSESGNVQKIGVTLEVTPQISPDGHIKLKLKPEVSGIFDWMKIEGQNAAPITTTRTAETEVLIKDGQTVVIGGLVKEESFNKVKKIPILGDIPLLGLLFTRKETGSTSNPTEKTDLLIFVTATIIKEKADKLVAWETNLITSPPRPFKLGMREVK
jgi:type IV pilus assembly protein PilQ